ncbi:MAG TPA: DUF4395 domain-containing protein [Acidimicrobiales bacterium]|nr:DUF4395 domain-containing protein [Acidimicrobiales bacterium]
MAEFFSFPNPVNETSARVVAGGVVAMAGAAAALDQPWLLFPLTYGFAARVTSGPKISPLGLLATKVVTPRIPVEHRFAPGPPKRLAQAMGLVMSATALLLHYRLGRPRAAKFVLSALILAASLEAGLGICLACKMFAVGMKVGVVPESICQECNDIWSRYSTNAA